MTRPDGLADGDWIIMLERMVRTQEQVIETLRRRIEEFERTPHPEIKHYE